MLCNMFRKTKNHPINIVQIATSEWSASESSCRQAPSAASNFCYCCDVLLHLEPVDAVVVSGRYEERVRKLFYQVHVQEWVHCVKMYGFGRIFRTTEFQMIVVRKVTVLQSGQAMNRHFTYKAFDKSGVSSMAMPPAKPPTLEDFWTMSSVWDRPSPIRYSAAVMISLQLLLLDDFLYQIVTPSKNAAYTIYKKFQRTWFNF